MDSKEWCDFFGCKTNLCSLSRFFWVQNKPLFTLQTRISNDGAQPRSEERQRQRWPLSARRALPLWAASCSATRAAETKKNLKVLRSMLLTNNKKNQTNMTETFVEAVGTYCDIYRLANGELLGWNGEQYISPDECRNALAQEQ